MIYHHNIVPLDPARRAGLAGHAPVNTVYEPRTYRNLVRTDDLVNFEVIVKETDLFVRAKRDLSGETRELVLNYRHQLETYISGHPEFHRSLIPVEEDSFAPEIVQDMIRASQRASVGPMAAVAGAVAQFVSKDLLPLSEELIVENGGDLYLVTSKERTIGIYAGSSPLSLKIGITVGPKDSPLGICTSSGTVGPSLSFGKADAICILSKSASLADAAATAVGNIIQEKKDVEAGLEKASEISDILGAVIIVGDTVGAWGDLNLVRL
jgi:ApbE superfamily uncharacterized protein (UPF0280 family)